MDVGVVTHLVKFVVQNVDNLCSSILPNIERCDHTFLIICRRCVDVEVDERVLFFELLKVLFCWFHRHLKAAVNVDTLLPHQSL